MKFKLLIIAILIGAGFQIYGKFVVGSQDEASALKPTQTTFESQPIEKYSCDGRTHCSQMTSCDEAKFFLDNCPGTAMDGDNDGVPCEKQWCQ